MYINVCKHCKKVFASKIKTGTCSECRQLDEEMFERIRTYLVQYPNSNAMQIAEGLEISIFEVTRYIDEGRLIVSKGTFSRLD